MSETLLALGSFRFSMRTAAYHTLRQSHQYRWPAQERLNTAPARQFVGLGEHTLDLEGTVYPHASGAQSLDQLKALAEQGVPLWLVDGMGYVWGQYVILSFQTGHSHLLPDGRPRKQTFQLQLGFYGED